MILLPLTIDPLLDDLSRRAELFFWEHTNPRTGLSKDRAKNAAGGDAYTISSSASTGFALVAATIGVERGWRDRAQAKSRARIALKTVNEKLTHKKGWLHHFVDWETGERQWKSEVSTIDTTILLAGIVAAARYWNDPEITREAKRFSDRLDWEWMRTDGGTKPNEPFVTMGWHPETGFISGRWGHTYDECKMLYILGAGTSNLPVAAWEKINRKPETYGGIPFITGGPLFLSQMSEAFFDFRKLHDRQGWNYEVAARNHARAQIAYTTANPGKFKAYGPRFFGLSACDGPDKYDAYGAPGWTNDDGTITPTSAVASVVWLPKEATEFAQLMRKEHPKAWGRYGFPNGYNPTRDFIDPDVIGIDLGMMMCAIENRRDGFVWRLTNSDPSVKRGFKRLGLKREGGTALRKS